MPRLLAMALACLVVNVAARSPGERDLNNYTYEDYLREFGKVSSKDDDVRGSKAVFDKNLALMRSINADPTRSWFATVNEFSDWSNEDFKARRTGHAPHPEEPGRLFGEAARVEDLPSNKDWRDSKGVVTPPKNQGGCGSCWAFSATETLESHLAIATGEPAPVLSPQQIVSCAPNPLQCGGTGGCGGSTQPLAFNYTMDAGISLEAAYPYAERTGTCQQSKIHPVAKNNDFVQLPVNDYAALMTAVATKGPIAISVAAGGFGWQLYGGGIYSGRCGFDIDHAVQLVGYGAQGSKLYWTVRNSWGAGWGEHGYMRMRRYGEGKEPCGMDNTPSDGMACKGDTAPKRFCGLCGILSASSYPTGLHSVGQGIVV